MPRDYTLGSSPNPWTNQQAPTPQQLDAVEKNMFVENPTKATRKAQDAPARPAKTAQRPASPVRSPAPQQPREASKPRPSPAPARTVPKPPRTRRRSKGATEHRFLTSFTNDGWRRLEAAAKRTGQSAAAILRVLVDEHLDPA